MEASNVLGFHITPQIAVNFSCFPHIPFIIPFFLFLPFDSPSPYIGTYFISLIDFFGDLYISL